ncbi:hypothetical protein [Orientia tsutsugamushi]|nr:hypothetical protein [Orientia tsutsugamushi]
MTIDIWFAKISKENLIEQTGIARYCDDMVFVFENESRCEKIL